MLDRGRHVVCCAHVASRFPLRALWLCLLGCSLSWLIVLGVRAESRGRRALPLIVVRSTWSEDAALIERVRGQTSDLEVRLVTRESSVIEASLAEQLQAARTLAAETSARVVVWFARAAERLDVIVADVQADRVLVRSLSLAEGPGASSARDEAAALVVRSALRASLHGDALGEPEAALVPMAPAPTPEPAPAEPAAPTVQPKPTPAPPLQARVRAALAAEGALDGATERGRYALSLSLSYTRGRLELGLAGGYGFRSEVARELARLSQTEHTVSVYGGYALVARERVRLALTLGPSLHLVTTEVRVRDTRLAPSADRVLLPALALDLRFGYFPRWLRARAGVGGALGLDAFPWPVQHGYHVEGRFVSVRSAHVLQPKLTLALLFML